MPPGGEFGYLAVWFTGTGAWRSGGRRGGVVAGMGSKAAAQCAEQKYMVPGRVPRCSGAVAGSMVIPHTGSAIGPIAVVAESLAPTWPPGVSTCGSTVTAAAAGRGAGW